jgi:murein DD-endopeptidase MepM/ murein hydrolase activator NlpD
VRQTFPSEAPRLAGGKIVYRADEEQIAVAEPAAGDFEPARRFETPRFVGGQGVSPDAGSVHIRRPHTQTNLNPPVFQYYDLDKRTGFTEDWYCSKMTYDGHLGTDFNQQTGRDVVAPSSGRVFWRYDGCANTKSQGCGVGFGNFAAMEHTDGSVSLEAHGKKWTVVERGERLSCGDKLMESAKSGNANAEHVHHESWVDKTGNVNKNLRYDPFKGSCDPNDPSKWSAQNGYRNVPGPNCSN